MRRLASIVLPLLVFCIGLAAGSWFSIGRRAAAFSAGVEQRLAQGATATPARIAETARSYSSDDDMLTAVMSAVSEKEPLLRAHRVLDVIGDLDSAQLAVLFDRAVRVDDRERRGTVLRALLARWAAIDPAGAAAAIAPYRERFRASLSVDWKSLDRAVNDVWAVTQPDAALAEAMAAPVAAWAQSTAWAAMNTLATGDAARQLDALALQPASRLRDEMCARAIALLAGKDTAAAEARLELLDDRNTRARVRSEILGKLAERDPAAGLARLEALAPDLAAGTDGMRLVSAILRPAAEKDLEGALAAVEKLPEDLRSQGLGTALVGWAGQHPMEALAWAAANGIDLAETRAIVFFGDHGSAGWNSLTGTAFGKDYTSTLAWLRAQPATSERDFLLREGIWSGTPEQKAAIFADLTPESQQDVAGNIVHSMSRDGFDRAETWAKSLPPGNARTSALQSLASQQARNAPERIDTLAESFAPGPDRDAALRGIVWSLQNSEPIRAHDFARRVSNPVHRELAIENVARAWLQRDAPAARTWLISTPELPAETKRVLLRQAEER